MKYQSSSTHYLKDISKVKVSANLQNDKDGMTDNCKYRFLFHTKNKQAYPPRVFRKYDKITHLCWQIYVQIYPEEVEQNCLYTEISV